VLCVCVRYFPSADPATLRPGATDIRTAMPVGGTAHGDNDDGVSANKMTSGRRLVPSNGVQDLSSEMSRQIASTAGAAHDRGGPGGASNTHSSVCVWTLPKFTKNTTRQVWSEFQSVCGHEVRLLVYPKGDSMALPGYISAYLQVNAPGAPRDKDDGFDRANTTTDTSGAGVATTTPENPGWECFVSYELSVRQPPDGDAAACADDDESLLKDGGGGDGDDAPQQAASGTTTRGAPVTGAKRDSWHRFSHRKKSHGWCDFARADLVLDAKNGFLVNDSLTIEARITVLRESSELVVEANASSNGGTGTDGDGSSSNSNNNNNNNGGTTLTRKEQSGNAPAERDVVDDSPALTGKFTWTVENLKHFRVMIASQKVMSPSFVVGDCKFRVSVYQSTVRGVECLSLCLESKEVETISGDKVRAFPNHYIPPTTDCPYKTDIYFVSIRGAGTRQ
jgi:hypothetical protein